MRVLALLLILAGCAPATRVETGGGTVRIPVPEKRCGENRETLFSAYSRADLEALADCTVLVGHFQQDSVTELRDFAPLQNVWKIEGMLNVFRSPGFETLHGLEHLEVVDGSLFVHMNPGLTSIEALANLREVTDRLVVDDNDRLPQAQAEAVLADVIVGGSKRVQDNGP